MYIQVFLKSIFFLITTNVCAFAEIFQHFCVSGVLIKYPVNLAYVLLLAITC